MAEYFTRPNIEKVVGKLGTTPEQRGLSTQEFKDKFDEMPEAIQQYIKETLLAELDAFKEEFMTHQADRVSAHGIDLKANKSMGETFAATAQNGWSSGLYYSKNDMGQVHIRGHITSGTLSGDTTVATIASSYAPPMLVPIPVMYNGKGMVGLYISTDGLIKVLPPLNAETAGELRVNIIYQT